MKKDIIWIVNLYTINQNLAREQLYEIMPMIFRDAIWKKWMNLDNQELYELSDLINESYINVDDFIGKLIEYWFKDMKMVKWEWVTKNEDTIHNNQIKWIVYWVIRRTARDCATEKYFIKWPTKKSWAAKMIQYWEHDTFRIVNKDSDASIPMKWDMPYVAFWYDEELNNEYIRNILINNTNNLTYKEKKILIKRYQIWMSAEEIWKDIKLSKKQVLALIKKIAFKIKEKVWEKLLLSH